MGDRTLGDEARLAQLSSPSDDSELFGPFPDLALRFLRACPRHFGADRAFLLLFGGPDESTAGEVSLKVVAAIAEDGRELHDPDFLIDHHYLGEIGALEGAQYLAGAEEGVSRPLLTLGFALAEHRRGIVLLEARPGDTALEAQGLLLELALVEELPDLRRAFLFQAQGEELERTRRQLLEIGELLDRRKLELDGLRHTVEEEGFLNDEVTRYHQFITCNARTQELIQQIERVKDTDLSVLLHGETGTGKELLARALHFGGRRSSGPFEVVPCGSLSANLIESELFGYRKGAFSGADEDRQGFFERAHGGTLFLDEVADMPNAMQQKLLRVVQEGQIRPIGAMESVEIDVRVIASTRRDLEEMARKKEFREDLLYRLDGFSLEIPPLRERREDIPVLVAHFLELASEDHGRHRFSESALRELYEYSWPGNVQELSNLVERAVIQSDRTIIPRKSISPLLRSGAEELFQAEGLRVDGEELVIRIPAHEEFNDIISECERLIIVHALRRHNGNKSRVTKQLGIPRQTLYNKIERYGITEDDYVDE